MVEEYLHDSGIDPPTLTLGSNGAIKQAGRFGLGVALQSKIAVGLELGASLLAPIQAHGELPERQWCAIHPASGPIRPPVGVLLSFLPTEGARTVGTASTTRTK